VNSFIAMTHAFRAARAPRSLRLTVPAALLAAALAQAAPLPRGDELPESLKGVQRYSGMCRRDAAASGVPDAAAAAPDMSCAIAAPDAARLLHGADVVWADLRTPQAFSTFHVDGAIRLDADALRSKPYWRAKDVVLLGDGKEQAEALALCATLKQQGYARVHVLQGGTATWLASALPVDGRPAQAGAQSRLSARELWAEAQFPANLVLLAKEQAALRAQLPTGVELAQVSREAVLASVAHRRAEHGAPPLASVVVAAPAGMSDDDIAALARGLAPVPVLVYSDTKERFAREYAQAKASWVARARGPRKPGCGL